MEEPPLTTFTAQGTGSSSTRRGISSSVYHSSRQAGVRTPALSMIRLATALSMAMALGSGAEPV